MSEEFFFYTKALSVGYHGTALVENIELKLKKGQILTLIGPNGAGKTTILRSIIGQLEPLRGAVFLDGKELGKISAGELAKKLSVVFTQRIRPEMMNCQQVVETGRYPYTGRFGILSDRDHQVVKESMELVKVSEIAGEPFEQISDGQRQLVMLARALSQEPEVIVLDEPTTFLDIRHKLEFLSVLQRLSKERGLSVVLSLHELDLAERISDQIACIRGEQVDRTGAPEEIFTQGYIRKLYGIREGNYEERTNTAELPKQEGTPQVFVIGGNGTGTPVYRRLQRQGIPFATGILWENDLDYPAARSLAAEVVGEKAFYRVRENTMRRAKELIGGCREVICTLKPEAGGDLYPELLELTEYGKANCVFH